MPEEYSSGATGRGARQTLTTFLVTQNLRYWLVLSWSFGLAYAAGWRLAALWGGAAAVAAVIGSEAERRAIRSGARNVDALLAVSVAGGSALWAIAPLLAWSHGGESGRLIAVSLLMAGFLAVLMRFSHRLGHAAFAASPYAAVAVWFALSLHDRSEFWTFALCIVILAGAIAANVLSGRVHYGQIQRYQDKQARLIGELEEARDVADAANAAKSAFLAMISHELRTPMNGVLGAAQLLDSDALTPAQRRYVEIIRTSGDSLLTLLNDILDFAKIEAGRVDLEAIEFDLPDLAERVGAVWSARAESKGLDYAVEIDAGAPALAVGDPTRLAQVMHNLLSNATKFTDQGRVALSLRSERLAADRARITIAVSDTGLGISPEDRARLFQPFSQLDSSSTRRFGGTGLGLAISRRLAELIGGVLDVESEPGRGSTFTLTFETEVASWTAVAGAAAPAAAAEAPIAPMRVLVVEDHAINRQILQLWLAAEGHVLACAENGQVALDLCAGQAFDIILMDVNMPVMDGLSAVRRLRQGDGVNARTTVVMLSASARAEDHEAGYQAGANAYLTKPIDFAALRAALAAAAAGQDAIAEGRTSAA
ncbi:MAG: ATP-binding protein [Caulobacteraceae bacterium]|nr:ATP-binding protein [Caulobacteraceae bacterium]